MLSGVSELWRDSKDYEVVKNLCEVMNYIFDIVGMNFPEFTLLLVEE